MNYYTVKTSKNIVKMDVVKVTAMKIDILFSKRKGDVKWLLEQHFLTDLLGSQYFFEIYHTSLTIKYSENIVKRGCFERRLQREAPTFAWKEGGI